ncbi:MAG: hypothetical protein N3G21_02000 [Candidatus Hydrogenedentes bacterium]|nr:hypothetical protein [Candidatus Hydrogenedentota bacterium]
MKFYLGFGRSIRILVVCILIFISGGRFSTLFGDGDNFYDFWVVFGDGRHNSNSDLTLWRGNFWLVHQNSYFHFGTSNSKVFLWTSFDAVNWRKVAEFSIPGEDIRDPKFAVINGNLFLYVLPNRDLYAEPYTTYFSYSRDGIKWSALREIEGDAKGWLLWRPKTVDFVNWYVTGYWSGHGKSALFRSKEGIKWELVSVIHEGDRTDETDFEFLGDHTILATLRLEKSDSIFGDPAGGTLIAVSKCPYNQWEKTFSGITRLDGPCLFRWKDKVLALGRRDLRNETPFWYTGSILNKKRTSLFVVEPDRLNHILDFPSCGDTSYGGVAVRGDYVYMCFYSSPVNTDPPWIIGMLGQTNIYLVRFEKEELSAVIGGKLEKTQ